jgi:hypothetical protein
MHPSPHAIPLLLALLFAACGVPRDAARLAAAGAALPAPAAEDDAATRAALADQADAWTRFAARLRDREPGGLLGVDPRFVDLAVQTAALARRQRDLIAASQDDPALNRQSLARLRTLWQTANAYLHAQ